MPSAADASPPEVCERAGCLAPVETWCPLCERFYCAAHDRLPDGHQCLGDDEAGL